MEGLAAGLRGSAASVKAAKLLLLAGGPRPPNLKDTARGMGRTCRGQAGKRAWPEARVVARWLRLEVVLLQLPSVDCGRAVAAQQRG